jgi:hypothetical protein
MMRTVAALLLLAGAAWPQKYSGPRPPQPDIPYLLHADHLVETESAQAQEQDAKKRVTFVIPGEHSPARTPLASPIFLLLADQLRPEQLQLYRLTSKDGQRQVLFSRKKKQVARPIPLNVMRLEENLYRIEVEEALENGEYSLTPSGSNQVFCFQVY